MGRGAAATSTARFTRGALWGRATTTQVSGHSFREDRYVCHNLIKKIVFFPDFP